MLALLVVRWRLLLALSCGAVLTAALPPLGIWPLTVAIAPVFALIAASQRLIEAFWLGFAFAVGLFASHVIWLPISLGPYSGGLFWVLFPPMLLILGCFWGGAALLCRRLGGRGGGTLLLLPAVWVLVEWLRSLGTFAFPWGLFGYVWLDTPVAGLASVGGVYGLSLLTAVVASLAAWPILAWGIFAEPGKTGRLVPVALALSLLMAANAAGGQLLDRPDSEADRTALLVQGATDPFGRAAGVESDLDVYLRLTDAALDEVDTAPDLVIWPEGVVMDRDLAAAGGESAREQIAEVSRGATTITGASAWSEDYQHRSYNSVYSLHGSSVTSRYDKFYLVPFGESAPFETVLSPVYRATFAWFGLSFIGGRLPGNEIAPLETPLGRAATYICYESVFPQVARAMVASGARVLVNISNDAWFGFGHGAEQHFDMGRMRAIETGRYLLRVGNDGITALVDPAGRVKERLPRGPEGTLLVNFRMLDHKTPYVAYGWMLPVVLSLYSLIVVAWRQLARG